MAEMESDKSRLGELVRNKWFQAASALGVLLGIIGFVLGLPPVADMAFGKRVSLTLDVVSQVPVFAVRQPVPGLSVQLNSQDLTQTRRDLVAVRLRLRNSGEVSINARNTTSRDPLGFRIRGGQVVRLYDLNATSDHLRKLAVPKIDGNSFVLPAGLIIDPNDYVQFDLLIVRPVNGGLSFDSLGKVEGLAKIGLGRADMAKPTPNVASVAWSGGLLPQLLRTVTYPFIAIALIGVVIVTGFQISELNAKRKRRKRDGFAAEVIAKWDQQDPKLRKLVPAMYAAMGMNRLTRLADTDALEKLKALRMERWKRRNAEKIGPLSDFEAGEAIEKWSSESEIGPYGIDEFLDRLKLRDDATGVIDPALCEAIKQFAAVLVNIAPDAKIRKFDPSEDDSERVFIHNAPIHLV